MYLLEEIKGQCFRCCPFLLCYNVGKQVNTDNKHRALLFISKVLLFGYSKMTWAFLHFPIIEVIKRP